MADWREAAGLLELLLQVNEKWPRRKKDSDGTIGDAAHQGRHSDHNPHNGVVHALDITHDPASGCDSYKIAEALRVSKDARISYIISNRRIVAGNGGPAPWQWRVYSGSNPHTQHVHISITEKDADNIAPWHFDFPVTPSDKVA